VRILSTQPHYGGQRWWFVCRLGLDQKSCNRRVERLYLPSGAVHFGCRHCHKLSYTSQQKGAMERHASLVNPAADEMDSGDSTTRAGSFPPKPKGIWEKTYRRLLSRSEQ